MPSRCVQVQALGPIPVKGLVEPVEVAALVGVSALRRRLQAAVARGLTRFVARQQELVALRQALERAATVILAWASCTSGLVSASQPEPPYPRLSNSCEPWR